MAQCQVTTAPKLVSTNIKIIKQLVLRSEKTEFKPFQWYVTSSWREYEHTWLRGDRVMQPEMESEVHLLTSSVASPTEKIKFKKIKFDPSD